MDRINSCEICENKNDIFRSKYRRYCIVVLNAIAGGPPSFLEMTNRHVAVAVVKLSLKNRKDVFVCKILWLMPILDLVADVWNPKI